MESALRFILKIRILGILRSLCLLFIPQFKEAKILRGVLIINLQGIGDMVAFTSVLRHYRKAFPGVPLILLVQSDMGLPDILGSFVDEVIQVNSRRFTKNPWYDARVIRNLQARKFETVISHDHSPAEWIGALIATSLHATNVVGYEGFLLPFERPLNRSMELTLRYIRQTFRPRFTTIIPSKDNDGKREMLWNVIDHYQKMYESVTGREEIDYAPVIYLPKEITEQGMRLFEQYSLGGCRYAVINLGSSQLWKNWPVDRFRDVAQEFIKHNISVVLVGSSRDRTLAEEFKKGYDGICIDLTGFLTIPETAFVISRSFVVLSNDTSVVHIGVAFKKPTLCILGGGHVGSNSHYGYADINHWIYTPSVCYLDNWRCTLGLRMGEPAPCIAGVSSESVRVILKNLLIYLDANLLHPKTGFQTSFQTI